VLSVVVLTVEFVEIYL